MGFWKKFLPSQARSSSPDPAKLHGNIPLETFSVFNSREE